MRLEDIKNLNDATKWYAEEYDKLKVMDASDEMKQILLAHLNATYANMVNWFNGYR